MASGPLLTLLQIPSMPARLHAWQAPGQAMLTELHAPFPVQFAAAVRVLTAVPVPSTHDWFRHPCPFPRNRQRAVPAALLAELFPAHKPSRPQLAVLVVATHAKAGSLPPAATAMQAPTEPAIRQDSQVPLQAELQQTPGLPSRR